MKTFLGVAEKHELSETQKARYITYMEARWKDEELLQCQTGYASEWAERFKAGIEMRASDCIGQEIFMRMQE